MADIKINDLVAYTDPVSTDVLPIVDVGNDLTKKVSIADLLENAGTGSATAPAFSFDGDNNTGIYRPGADQVALTAGGTQALLAESTGITIPGNLTVSGTTTTVNTVNLTVKDKNIELGVVSTPTNTTADGGGITLKGATDKTINWVNSTGAWTLSEHINIANAKEYRINGTKVLDATSLGSAVVSSSLTSVGTIATGVWNGTALTSAYIGADAINGTKIADNSINSEHYVDGSIDTAHIADSQITSAKILDGTIVNADINASAAITGSKITTGTTSAVGVLQLTNSTSSTSTTTAATPNSVKTSFDLANAALPKAGGTLTGDLTIPDKIIHSGDTNTFIRFPAADTFSVETAGSERLRIDSSGRLLVGTSTSVQVPLSSSTLGDPSKQLASTGQAGATNAQYVYSTNPTVAPNLILAKSRGALNTQGLVSNGDSLGRVVFEGSDGQAVGTNSGFIRAAVIEAKVDGTASAGDMPGRLVFSTTADGASSPTERMRIDSSGNVGIGTDSPNHLLHVGSGTNSLGTTAGNELLNLRIQSDTTNEDHLDFTARRVSAGTTWVSAAQRIQRKVDATPMGYIQLGNHDSDLVTFGRNNTEYARLDNSGNVGIGTSSPQAKLDVAGTILTETVSYSNNQDEPYLIAGSTSYTGATTNWGTYGFQHRIKTNSLGVPRVTLDTFNGEAFCVNNPGNVGIGTSDPQAKLQVAGDVIVDSGFITLNGNKLGAIKVIIADDAFATITPPRVGAGHILVVEGGDEQFPNSNCRGFAYADWGNSPGVTSISVGSAFETSSAGPPNGTTGSDVHATLFGGGTSGVVYLENRLGSSGVFFVNFL